MAAPTADDVLNALIAVHRESGEPVADAPELADRLDGERRTILARLRVLEASGDVESKPISSGVAWWAPSCVRVETPHAEPEAVPDTEPEPEPAPELPEETDELPQSVLDAIESWEPPGDEVQQEARRAALRALCEFLRCEGRAKRQDFVRAFWDAGEHRAEWGSEGGWWNGLAKGTKRRTGGLAHVADETEAVTKGGARSPWRWRAE